MPVSAPSLAIPRAILRSPRLVRSATLCCLSTLIPAMLPLVGLSRPRSSPELDDAGPAAREFGTSPI